MIVRLSRGRYHPSLHPEIVLRLRDSAAVLLPAIRGLPGCLSYYAASDEASGTLVNVSVWDTLAHAQAMATLAPMLALATDFAALGVEFERPIINYETLWSL
jgi:quinol monooxygenase YgiN